MPELVSCIPDRPDAHVADLDAVNKPENDEPSIVEPIESFAARHPLAPSPGCFTACQFHDNKQQQQLLDRTINQITNNKPTNNKRILVIHLPQSSHSRLSHCTLLIATSLAVAASGAALMHWIPRRAQKSFGAIVRIVMSLSILTALGASAHAEQFSLNDFPAPLVKKVAEIQKACGSQIVSAYRPGAVTPYGNASEHAFKRAVDLSGNPKCIYQHLEVWEGGVSIDYAVVGHVHISWHPGGTEQGVRFAHAGGGLMGALYRLWAGVLKIFD